MSSNEETKLTSEQEECWDKLSTVQTGFNFSDGDFYVTATTQPDGTVRIKFEDKKTVDARIASYKG